MLLFYQSQLIPNFLSKSQEISDIWQMDYLVGCIYSGVLFSSLLRPIVLNHQ